MRKKISERNARIRQEVEKLAGELKSRDVWNAVGRACKIVADKYYLSQSTVWQIVHFTGNYKKDVIRRITNP